MTAEIFRCANAEGDRLCVTRIAGSLCFTITDDVTAAIALTQEQEQQMLAALAPDLRERTRALMQALDEAPETADVNQLRAMLYAHLQPHAARLGLAGVL